MITVDFLINSAVIAFFVLIFLTAFYEVYTVAEEGLRKAHLRYLSTVIEDRMRMCENVDNIKIYAPYRVEIRCSAGEVCWKDVCVPVSCKGGGEGITFVIRDCHLHTLE